MTPVRWFAGGIALLLGGVILHTVIVVDDIPDITHEVATYVTENSIALWGPHTVGQTILPPSPNISGISLSLRRLPGTRLSGQITLHLRESADAAEDLRTVRLPATFVQGDPFTDFLFPPLPTQNREQLYFFVEYAQGTEEAPLALRAEQRYGTPQEASIVDYQRGTLTRDHQAVPGDLAFRLLKRARRPLGLQGVAAAILGGAALMTGGIASFAVRRGRMRASLVLPMTFGIIGAGLPLVFTLPFFIHPSFLGIGDWDMNTTLHAAAERAIIREQSFPSWNPYLCGGTPLAAFPEAPVFSPFFSTVLLGGAVQGFKVNILLHGSVAFLGMLVWLRKGWKVSWPAAFLGAAVFAFSPYIGLHLAAGHSRKVAAAWIPWILFFFQRAMEEKISKYQAPSTKQFPKSKSPMRTFGAWILELGASRGLRWTAPAGAFLSLMFLDGSVYLSVYTATFVALVGAFASVLERRWRPIVAGILVLLLGGTLAGVHLVPAVLSQTTLKTELRNETSPLPVSALWSVFLDPDQRDDAQKFDAQTQPWFEYGAYVGIGPLLLAFVGLLVKRKTVVPWVGAGLFFLLVPLSGYLQRWSELIPLFGDLRNPQRMLGMMTIVIGILAAIGFERLTQWLQGSSQTVPPEHTASYRAIRASLGVLAAILIGHMIFMNTDTLANTFIVPPPPAREAPFQQGWARSRHIGEKDSFAFTMENTVQNRGSMNRCSVASVRTTEALRIPLSKPGEEVAANFQDAAYLGEAFFLEGEGSATVDVHTTNRVRVRYETRTPAILAINENMHHGWSVVHDADGASSSRPADGTSGLVTTSLSPGSGVVTFSYATPGLGAGILVTTLGIIASLSLWYLAARKSP
ncbi:MAG: hypothetical protein G01um1014106_447 [Parcubacteria group bacterium Gr01-1014_106]|nr:MAG: hypothetical protein G01um1014106_447 [Parcubacteria group bacterium Gr01-1014_106]